VACDAGFNTNLMLIRLAPLRSRVGPATRDPAEGLNLDAPQPIAAYRLSILRLLALAFRFKHAFPGLAAAIQALLVKVFSSDSPSYLEIRSHNEASAANRISTIQPYRERAPTIASERPLSRASAH
jgi:hypothetical protein